jgi:hypothetical protein
MSGTISSPISSYEHDRVLFGQDLMEERVDQRARCVSVVLRGELDGREERRRVRPEHAAVDPQEAVREVQNVERRPLCKFRSTVLDPRERVERPLLAPVLAELVTDAT